jgi:hypothetical protein
MYNAYTSINNLIVTNILSRHSAIIVSADLSNNFPNEYVLTDVVSGPGKAHFGHLMEILLHHTREIALVTFDYCHNCHLYILNSGRDDFNTLSLPVISCYFCFADNLLYISNS